MYADRRRSHTVSETIFTILTLVYICVFAIPDKNEIATCSHSVYSLQQQQQNNYLSPPAPWCHHLAYVQKEQKKIRNSKMGNVE